VEKLVELERKFRNDICKYARATEVYSMFISYVDDKENGLGSILSAQPFFREVSKTFSKSISPAIRDKKPQELMKFDINYQLIKFIADNWGGPLPARSQKYLAQLTEARRILIENNLPLAINRAKIFYNKTPKTHLNLLDLIDICVYGLIVGVDKFAADYSKVWCSVGIGRMVGFMIEEYSKSFIRMYPSDKKILYRANALKHRLKIENVTELTEAVNESFYKDKEEGIKTPALPVTEIHIRTLMNSSTYISADSKIGSDDDDEGGCIYDYTAHPDSVEDGVEKRDVIKKILETSGELAVIERKIIRLKGVEL
jgi:DNA-directed RNA polymerase specialized sigma subunit